MVSESTATKKKQSKKTKKTSHQKSKIKKHHPVPNESKQALASKVSPFMVFIFLFIVVILMIIAIAGYLA